MRKIDIDESTLPHLTEAVQSSTVVRGPTSLTAKSAGSRSLRGADLPGSSAIEHYKGEQFYPGQFSPGVPRRNPWRGTQLVLEQRRKTVGSLPNDLLAREAALVRMAQSQGRAKSVAAAAQSPGSSSHESSQLAHITHALASNSEQLSSAEFDLSAARVSLETLGAIQEVDGEDVNNNNNDSTPPSGSELKNTPAGSGLKRGKKTKKNRVRPSSGGGSGGITSQLARLERISQQILSAVQQQAQQLEQLNSRLAAPPPSEKGRPAAKGPDAAPGRQRSLGKHTFESLEQECMAKSLHQGAVLGTYLATRKQLERVAKGELDGPARRSPEGHVHVLRGPKKPSLVRNAVVQSLHERLARCEDILTRRGPPELKQLAERSRQSQERLENAAAAAAASRSSNDLSQDVVSSASSYRGDI